MLISAVIVEEARSNPVDPNDLDTAMRTLNSFDAQSQIAYQIYAYAEELRAAVTYQADAPTPPLLLGDKTKELGNSLRLIGQSAERLSKIKVDMSITVSPELLASTDLRIRRSAVMKSVSITEAISMDMLNQQRNLSLIRDVDASSRLLMDYAKKLKKSMELLLTANARNYPALNVWSDLENHIIKDLSLLIRSTSKSISTLEKSIDSQAIEFDNLVSNLHTILRAEAEALTEAEQTYNELQKSLQTKLKAIEDEYGDMQAMELQLSNLAKQIADTNQLKEDTATAIKNLNKRISEKKKRIDSQSRKIKNLLSARNDVCPNKYSWNDCDHDELKTRHIRREDAARAHLTELKRSLRISDERKKNKQAFLEKIDESLASCKNERIQLEAKRNTLKKSIDRDFKRFQLDWNQLRSKRKSSGIDLKIKGNRKDQMRLMRVLSRDR